MTRSTLSSHMSALCPLSPTGVHRLDYGRVKNCCGSCGLDVVWFGGAWQVPPPGEIVVGLMAEFQARMIEGDPNRVGEPRGIFGAAGAVPLPRSMMRAPRIVS